MKAIYILPVVPILFFSACQQAPDAVADEEESAAVANFVPPQPIGEGDPNVTEQPGPEGAVAVVKAYYDAFRSGRPTEAYRMWDNKGQDSGMTDTEFAEHVRSFDDIDVAVEEPGPMEGAAGSIYIQVPVKLSGVGADGKAIDSEGKMTLRRVNNVPGASQESLRWHITDSSLATRP